MRADRVTSARIASILCLAAVLLVTAGAASAAIAPVTNDAAGANALAGAIAGPGAVFGAASFQNVPTTGTPNATSDALAGFPTNGPTFAIMTSGDAQLADDPNSTGSSGASLNNGPDDRGDTAYDITVLQIPVTVAAGQNCLSLDFQFLSEEFPEFVGSSYNDGFIAELDVSNWTTSGSVISAPNNFAFDANGDVVSINSSGATSMNAANAAGTTYDGATVLLSASKQVTPGAHTLFLSIFDQGDRILDSAVFLDNVVVGFVPDPAQQCKPGAAPKNFNLTLGPPTATNNTGTPHVVTATLTEDGQPKAGAVISFTVTGPNPTTGTGTTNASGNATFTYTGANAGTDTIVACYDADANGTCGNTGDPIASATKTWVQVPTDTTPPECALFAAGTDANGKKYIDIRTRDTGSGLASITVLKSVNANTVVPPFVVGTTGVVMVRGTKIVQSSGSVVELRVTDVAGNSVVCDPVLTVVLRGSGEDSQTHSGLPAAESKILVVNDTPGVRHMDFTVNGVRFRLRNMADGGTYSLNVASAMKPGNANTITIDSKGPKGGSALVVISD